MNAEARSEPKPTAETGVLCCTDADPEALAALASRYGLQLAWGGDEEAIPGSFWGESEAGLVGTTLHLRADTPLHSALHELCHYVCMDEARRAGLDTDAGGDYDEENGVCYLQVLLAESLPGMGRTRMFVDMDAWGYSFRLGSARAWFESDAEDAHAWLRAHDLVDATGQPSGRLRTD